MQPDTCTVDSSLNAEPENSVKEFLVQVSTPSVQLLMCISEAGQIFLPTDLINQILLSVICVSLSFAPMFHFVCMQ